MGLLGHPLSKRTLCGPASNHLQFTMLPHGGSIAPVCVKSSQFRKAPASLTTSGSLPSHLPTWMQYFPSAKVSRAYYPSVSGVPVARTTAELLLALP